MIRSEQTHHLSTNCMTSNQSDHLKCRHVSSDLKRTDMSDPGAYKGKERATNRIIGA